MFSLFKHIDIDCVYQLKTSSIFLPRNVKIEKNNFEDGDESIARE